MATITTNTFLDGGTARTAGEAWTCNGGKLTIRTDTRWHANAPASMTGTIAATTISATLGGGVLYDGRNVRWMPFDTGTSTVPAIGTTITQGGVSAYLLGVWDTLTSAPTAVGAAMPADGFIKFREVTGGPFIAGALTGIGASATGPDVTGWIEVVQDNSVTNTIPRKGTGHQIRGDWFYLDNTTGSRAQVLQVPTNGGGAGTTSPGVWIETGVGTDAYEYWPALSSQTAGNGWLYTHLGQATGTADRRQKFVKGLGSGQMQIGDTATPLAATYASVSQASTYTWARDLLTVTFTAHGHSVGQQVYLDFTTGGGTPDGVYTVAQVTGANSYIINLAGSGTSGNVTAVGLTTVTFTAHGLAVGNLVQANVSTGTLASGAYEIITVVDANNFRIATPIAPLASGNVSIAMDIGYVPVSGCKVRIPNVFVRHATTAARASNDRTSVAVRPTFTTTGAGAIDHEYAYGDVLYSVTQPYSFKLHHCATMDQMAVSECATGLDMLDGGVSMDLAGDLITFSLTSNFAGGTISGWKFYRGNAPGTGDHAVSISLCSGQTFTNCEAGIVQFPRNSGAAFNVSQSKNLTFTDCTAINGGAFAMTTCTDVNINNHNHVDRVIGVTNATSATYAFQVLSKCNNIVINGVSEGWNNEIVRQHAYAGVLTVTASDNIKLRNVGTVTAPLGTSPVKINDRGVIYASGGNNSNISLQRCYVTTVRTNIFTDLNSDKNVLYEHVRAKHLSTYMPFTLVSAALNAEIHGCQAPLVNVAANASVYGSHIQDSITSWFKQFGTYTWSGDLVTVSSTNHGLQVGDLFRFNVNSGTLISQWNVVNTVTSANAFTFYSLGSVTSGDCTFYRDHFTFFTSTDDTDLFTTQAKLNIPMNEPTAETSGYVTITGNAQFTSAPGLTLPSSGDEVVFETQRRILGYTGVGRSPLTITGAPAVQAVAYTWAANVVTVTFTAHGLSAGDTVFLDATSGTLPDGFYVINGITSNNVYTISLTGSGTSGNANAHRIFRLRYQIDRSGLGYEAAWHNLDYPKAGVSTTNGSPIVTMHSTEGIEGGDVIIGNNIPGECIVVSIDSDTQITMGSNALATQTNQIVRFSYLGEEGVFDYSSILLKVSVTAMTPGSTMALTYISIPLMTDSLAMELQYPLDTNTITLTGLKNPTEIRIFSAGTETEITGQEDVTSGTYAGSIDAATYPSIDISIISLGYQNTRLLAVDMSGGDVTIPVQQVIDRQYGNL